MDDYKLILAKNVVALRHRAGWTQQELADKLHYSDKAVSKWERGESVPDLATLMSLAELFSVSVDDLLHDHTEEKAEAADRQKRKKRNRTVISLMSAVLVWLIATWAFVNIDLLAPGITRHWLSFVVAVPVSLTVLLVFNSIWGRRSRNFVLISALMWSILVAVFLTIAPYRLWPIFFVGIPGQIIVLLWSRIQK